MANPYEIAHKQSIEDPDGFWGAAAEDCHWYKKWDKVLDDSNKPFYRWFSGGEMNTCYNMLDYHIENGRRSKNIRIYNFAMKWPALPEPLPLRAWSRAIGF
jgi:propionyl-CoA synthetase